MTPAAVVVFGWAGFNAVLLLVLVGYSFVDPFPLALYAIAVALLGGFGTVVLAAARRRAAGPYRMPTKSVSAAFLGLAAALIGIAFVYGWWIMLTALYPLVMAVVVARGERLPATAVPAEPVADSALAHRVPLALPGGEPAERRAEEPGRKRRRWPAIALGAAGVLGWAIRAIRRRERR
jgi:hypothetical protein